MKVYRLWEASDDDVLKKLNLLQDGLGIWARWIRYERNGLKTELVERLCEILKQERDDASLEKLIDTKV